jgi:hypothetical protein
VVELVRHTLLDSSVGLDIDDISNLVNLQVSGERDGTMLSEVTREHVAGTTTEFLKKKKKKKKKKKN